MRILYLLFLYHLGSSAVKYTETDLILSFLKENDVRYCFFLVCWTKVDKVNLSKLIMGQNINTMTTFLSTREGSINKAIINRYSKVTYILDLSCEDAFQIFKEGSDTFKFTYNSSWLLFGNDQISLKDVKHLFDEVELRMDSDIKIAIQNNNGSQYVIYEVYSPGLEVTYKLNKIGSYSNGKFSFLLRDSRFFQARRNMTGVLIRTATVVNFTAEVLWKSRNLVNYHEKGGLFTLYLYHLFQVFVELLKYRYNTTLAYPYFGPSDNGTDGGIGKLLYNNKVDVSTAGGSITLGRMAQFDVLQPPYLKVRTSFYYRSPGTKKPGAQVMKPLAPDVWYCILAALIITCGTVKLTYWVEEKFIHSNHVYTLFTSVMIAISTLSQQGSEIVPQHLGGRIMFLNILIFSICIYNYYTSSLVSSLLNSEPEMMTTFRELYESPLEVGMENESYTGAFVALSKDPYLKQLYAKKICGNRTSHGPNIFPARVGMEKVRRGGFAYHTMGYTAYPIISSTFDQEAICDMGEIIFMDYRGGSFLTQRSQYYELFKIGFTKLWENGVSKQVYDNVIIEMPKCRSAARLLAVGPEELFLVYMIFLLGILFAIIVLIAEMVYFKMNRKEY